MQRVPAATRSGRLQRRAAPFSAIVGLLGLCAGLAVSTVAVHAHSAVASAPSQTRVPARLCPQGRPAQPLVDQMRLIVSRRLVGYGLNGVTVAENGACLRLSLPHHRSLRQLLLEVVSRGRLTIVQGGTLEPRIGTLIHGNKVLVNENGIERSSVRLRTEHSGAAALFFGLVPSVRGTLCRYTSAHLHGFVLMVVDGHIAADIQMLQPLCSSLMQIGFPARASVPTYSGPLTIYLDMRFGPLPVPLRLCSLLSPCTTPDAFTQS